MTGSERAALKAQIDAQLRAAEQEREEVLALMRLLVSRKPLRHCIYCGRAIRRGRACKGHADLLQIEREGLTYA